MFTNFKTFFKDVSLSAVVAGFVVILVGYTSSMVLVIQAAQKLGATQGQNHSWMWALGMGMGLCCLVPSLRYKAPVIMAWSSPGAALIAKGSDLMSLNEATGAFVLCALMIIFAGVSGWFERTMKRIPIAIASAMLAGVLLPFSLEAFTSVKAAPVLVGTMFLAYLLGRVFFPRYAVVGVLVVGY